MTEVEPRNFLQPCLLLLLHEHPDHGYELVARLRPLHDGDPGGVYRALRELEGHGQVRSQWQLSDVGPVRRRYVITPDGLLMLDVLAGGLARSHEVLHVFLQRYQRLSSPTGCATGSAAAGRTATAATSCGRAGGSRGR